MYYVCVTRKARVLAIDTLRFGKSEYIAKRGKKSGNCALFVS